MGFMTIDRLADKLGIKVNRLKFKAKVGDGIVSGHKVVFVKPQTYMNLSGFSVAEIVDFYKIDNDHLIVIYDDIYLDPGNIRIRKKGSAGGHNGMKSIIQMLGTDRFLRIRIGTGHPPDDYLQIDWVLGHFPLSQRAVMEQAFDRACRAAEALLTTPPELVMSEYNRADEAAGAQDAQE
jgi:PTH1 family peptidyl-tRNA hydrolase